MITVFSFVYSQEQDDNTASEYNQALQFSISDRFSLGSLDGTILSYQKKLSNKWWLRIGTGMLINTADTKSHFYYEPDSTTTNFSSSNTSFRIELQALGEFHPIVGDKTDFYIAFGPQLEYYASKSYDYDYTDNIWELDREGQRVGVGVVSLFGVEWKLTRYLSIKTEYGAEILRSTNVDTRYEIRYDRDATKIENESVYVTMSPKSVALGLALYFGQ